MPKICSIENCSREVGKHGAKGMCPLHYRRTRDGVPIHGHNKPIYSKCTVDGCEKKPRSTYATLCSMHYHRAYRSGDVGEAAPRRRNHKNEYCSVQGCQNPDEGAELCRKHYARWQRHGDVHKVIKLEERNLPTGEAHPYWGGDNIGYGASHERVRSRRGDATSHKCADCAGPAHHWSYNHDAPNEKEQLVSGYWVAYSPSVEHYSPRCVPCHKAFDLARVNGTTPVIRTMAMR